MMEYGTIFFPCRQSRGRFFIDRALAIAFVWVLATYFSLLVSAQGDIGWYSSPVRLSPPRALASVVFYNDSFLIVGGCVDVECNEMSPAVSLFDPTIESMIQQPELPIWLTDPLDPGYKERMTMSGFYSTVAVGFYDIFSSRIITRLWVGGMCSFYLPEVQGYQLPEIQVLKYRTLWGLNRELTMEDRRFSLPKHLPTKANASCVAFGNRIYIIGGVYVDSIRNRSSVPKLSRSIDVFDTVTGKYYEDFLRTTEPVMNSAVTIDNQMMYIIGGERLKAIPKTQQQRPSEDDDPSYFYSHLELSTSVTAYVFPRLYWLNETLQIHRFSLPSNPYLANGTSSEPPTPLTPKNQLPRVFSFAGLLIVISSTSRFTTLNFTRYSGRMDEASWQSHSIPGTKALFSTLMGFPYVDSFEGTKLTFYSFGGISMNPQQDKNLKNENQQTDVDDDVSSNNNDWPITQWSVLTSIFFRFSVYRLPAPIGHIQTVYSADSFVTIKFSQAENVLIRLSTDIACYGNAAGTTEVALSWSNAEATFFPTQATPRVYICVGHQLINLSPIWNQTVTLYSVTDAYSPFAVLPKINPVDTTSAPTTPPSQTPIPTAFTPTDNNGKSGQLPKPLAVLLTISIIVVLFGGILVVSLRGSRRGGLNGAAANGHQYPLLYPDGTDIWLDQDPDIPQKDSVVCKTTSDSRYRVVRRIGCGSFSTVYLVARKSDGEFFAMKFMTCADDRERLEAIKECETINSLQGHPNIIMLYDMFMNYEFNQATPHTHKKESGLSDNGQPTAATTTLIEDGGPNRLPRRDSGLAQQIVTNYGATGNTPGNMTSPQQQNNQQQQLLLRQDSSSPITHNRYLCLVMEYHPAGDLAHYVLNHSSRPHNNPNIAHHHRLSNDLPFDNQPLSGNNGSLYDAGILSNNSASSLPSSAGAVYGANQPLSEPMLLSVAYQLLSVLKHLHSQRPPIVHRDLKPENVLLREYPSQQDSYVPVVVTDFGLAFIQEEHRKGGKGGGTRPYIAPECWKGNVCTASDIWSLGCVLYAVATQRLTTDTVRVMFVDARSPNFTEDLIADLKAHGYSEQLAFFVVSLLCSDPKFRPTAAQLMELFVSDGSQVTLRGVGGHTTAAHGHSTQHHPHGALSGTVVLPHPTPTTTVHATTAAATTPKKGAKIEHVNLAGNGTNGNITPPAAGGHDHHNHSSHHLQIPLVTTPSNSSSSSFVEEHRSEALH